MSSTQTSPALPAESTVLEIRNLRKLFGGVPALDDVSFSLEKGTIHALLGGNGSGKSTTIKILAGVYDADGGAVRFGEADVAAAAITPSTGRELGMRFVHQQSSTFPELTVAENLFVGRGFGAHSLAPLNWRSVNRRAAAILDRFQINAEPRGLLGDLSLANQTMVAIARALQDLDASKAGVLVLDEPTSALPPAEVDRLLTALKGFARGGQTIMYVTHRLEEVVRVADAATVLRDGRVAEELRGPDITHDRLVEAIMGQATEVAPTVHRSVERESQTALQLDEVVSGPIRGVSIELRKGEVVGIAGLLGSGRSTILKTLFGLAECEQGAIRLPGGAQAPKSPREAIRSGFAYVPEDRAHDAAFSDLSITENLGIASTSQYFRKGFLRHRHERRDAREVMSRYLVKAAAEDLPLAALSGGNQQKVILARWLRLAPQVLLLDEPSQGVDVGARREIWSLIHDAVSRDAAALVVSSDFEELATFCDRVVSLRNGRIVDELSGDRLTAYELELSLLRSQENR